MTVNLAIIGIGRIGKIHANSIFTHPNAKLVGFFDENNSEIKNFSEKKKFPVIMTSKKHKRCLDRVNEAILKLSKLVKEDDIIICVQGDEPMIKAKNILKQPHDIALQDSNKIPEIFVFGQTIRLPLVVGVVRNCKKEWLDDSRREESIHLEAAKARLFAEYITEVEPGIIESIEINEWPDWAIQLLPIIPEYSTGEIPDSFFDYDYENDYEYDIDEFYERLDEEFEP